MPLSLERQLTPEEEELERKRTHLAQLEGQLADRELERASLLAELAHFEKRYLSMVGRRYAVLDDLKAQIAEAHAARTSHPDAREQARQAEQKARESAQAVGGGIIRTPTPDELADAAIPNQSAGLRRLYRQAAKLLHPDKTLDGAEKERRHHVMAELNDAYARGDEERIQAIIRDWHSSPESVQGDGPGAELVRLIRTIAQVEKRLQAIATELEELGRGELFRLKQAVEEALTNRRDLLKDMGDQLDREIVHAREEVQQARSTSQS